MIGYLVSAVAGAGSAAVLFRHLHTELTGLYVLASSIVAIVAGVSDLGMTTLGLRELANRDAAGRRELMRTLLGLRLFDSAWHWRRCGLRGYRRLQLACGRRCRACRDRTPVSEPPDDALDRSDAQTDGLAG